MKQYQRLFEMEDVRLDFHEDALRAIARKALQRKTGARGLRSIMEGILLDPMFDLPGLSDVERIVIGKDVVDVGSKPLYVHSERPRDAALGLVMALASYFGFAKVLGINIGAGLVENALGRF